MDKRYGTLAHIAFANDYTVVPCDGKKPYPRGWPNADKEQAEQWVEQYTKANTGLVCGDVIFADLDINEPIFLGIAEQQVTAILGPSSYVVGRTNSPRIKIAYRAVDNVRKRKIVVEGGHIEILAKGQQGVVAGKLPCGSVYSGGERLLNTPKEEFPLITGEMLQKLEGERGRRRVGAC